MNKTTVFLFFFLYGINTVKAQEINYEPSFENAQQKAKKENKPVAILLTYPNSSGKQDGIKNKEVVEKLNNNFINYHSVWDDTARAGKIIRAYRITRFPSFIFLDAKAGILFSDIAMLASKQALLDMLNKALSFSGQTSLADYDSIYKSGNRSSSFLKEYILRRQAAGLKSNANLVEEYVNDMSVSALGSYNEVLFILKAGPYIDSTAYRLAWLHKNIADSIYKTEPLDERIAMNNTIIANSMDNAVANRNFKRAMATANFARNAWERNPHEGFRSYNRNMLGYYLGTRDTTSYLNTAITFYDRFYMEPSVDSLKARENLRRPGKKNTADTIAIHDSTKYAIKSYRTFAVPKNNPDAHELNNAAWIFYRFTSKEKYLSKALLWSRRSIELDPRPAYYDTYAHILYKMGLYAEALTMEKKAIELAKAEKMPDKNYQDALKKIISKTL